MKRSKKRSANGRATFRIFLIDSGWKSSIREAVFDNLDLFTEYLEEHEIYVLDRANSKEIFKEHPGLIGNAPALVVLEPDTDTRATSAKRSHGVSLNLGRARNAEQAARLMRWLCEILANRASAKRLDEVVRRTAHREGLSGALSIITDTAAHLAEGE